MLHADDGCSRRGNFGGSLILSNSATVALFCDSRRFLRQSWTGFNISLGLRYLSIPVFSTEYVTNADRLNT